TDFIGSRCRNSRATLHIRNGGAHFVGDRIVLRSLVIRAPWTKHNHLALYQLGEMLFDGAIDIGRRGDDAKLARKGIEVAHFDLALASELGLLLHRIGKMAGNYRDDHE